MDDEWAERYLEAWNSHDGRQVAAFMADDGTYEDLAMGTMCEGPDAVAELVAQSHTFSGDYRFVPVSKQSDGSRYALEWEMLGTNTGPAGGFPATDKPYRIRGVSIGELGPDGRIAVNRDYWNLAALLTELGLLPPPPAV